MQVILDGLNGMIQTALRTYLATERELDVANEGCDPSAIREAKKRVNLAARQAVLLHHFADFVLKEPDLALPAFKPRRCPQCDPTTLRVHPDDDAG